MSFLPTTLKDLARSGLTPETISLAEIQDPESNSIISTILKKHGILLGYQIPYFHLDGTRNNFYRLKVIAPTSLPKYLQPKQTLNHIYLPPSLTLQWPNWQNDPSIPLVITEGEKKALAGCQAGFPTIGLGGVSSWRNTTMRIEKKSLVPDGDKHVLYVPENPEFDFQVAEGLSEIVWAGREVFIVFDSDASSNPNVQDSAFELAWWLLQRDAVPQQIALPASPSGGKQGLDDLLLSPSGSDWFSNAPTHFPLPPHPRKWVEGKLNTPHRLSRPDRLKIAEIITRDLDSKGRRFRAPNSLYYFRNDTRELLGLNLTSASMFRQSDFGSYLGNTFGVHTTDNQLLSDVQDLYLHNEGIADTVPRRTIATVGDALYFQTANGRMARVTADSIDFVDNGTDDVLFARTDALPVDEDAVWGAIEAGHKGRWYEALQSVNLQPLEPFTMHQTRVLLSTLFYLSPWLNRWRGLQLPLEIAVAEPNSGKTFLYNLRMAILTGDPSLSGMPTEYKDWAAQVGNSKGMWVADNFGSAPRDFWTQLNDTLARLVTDPIPRIELRKLYSDGEVAKTPVYCTFAITTIKNPFTADDVLQRSILFNLQAIPSGQRNSNWYKSRMGERDKWVGEHLLAIYDFLNLVREKWNPDYLSGHRLVNFEQALLLMGEAIGFGEDIRDIVGQLPKMTSEAIATNDPNIAAFVAFVQEWESPTAHVQDVVDWAQNDPEERYSALKVFQNNILLGKWMSAHADNIKQATGIEMAKRRNQTILKLPTKVEAAE